MAAETNDVDLDREVQRCSAELAAFVQGWKGRPWLAAAIAMSRQLALLLVNVVSQHPETIPPAVALFEGPRVLLQQTIAEMQRTAQAPKH